MMKNFNKTVKIGVLGFWGFGEMCIRDRGRQAAHSALETIQRIPEIDSNDEFGEYLENLQGEIKLKNFSFTYPT